MRLTSLAMLLPVLVISSASHANGIDPETCQTVRMSDPGWTDINATNAVAGTLLQGLGYKQEIKNLSVPVGFQGLKTKQLDVFLGNWMPAQEPVLSKFTSDDSVAKLVTNLPSAKFTLVVPDYVAAAGVKSFKDLAKYADKFDKKIYGIAPGSPANQNIAKMISKKDFNLDGWSLVASSETGMLTQAERAIHNKQWIVFLGWEPHVMNAHFKLTYLSDGDAYFGPNYGSATVNTLTRKNFTTECPNAGKLFSNLQFNVELENNIIKHVLDDKQDVATAAKNELTKHPELLDAWLAGVKTVDGQDGLAAVKKSLGL